ncbi:MAG: hypothetical protein FWE92_04575 [Defluviitaleaceae bacterium]|nr:hypothetical protein [Defluviitaleaceae bacterium]
MGGTKIFVLQVQQIRKVLLIAAAVVAAILLVMFLFGGRSAETPTTPHVQPAPQQQAPPPAARTPETRYVPGTYFSEITLANSTIIVSVEVSENAILNVSIYDPYEAQEMFYPLMQPTMDSLSQQIVTMQSLNVQMADGTPYTQEVLISAIRNALDAAMVR